MKKLYLNLIILFSISANAQLGCTDINANNYNASATTNNGSCTYNASTQVVTEIGNLVPTVLESSGIIYDSGFIFTHNDSGNPSKFYKNNATTGALLQTIDITNFTNDDWEDIASDNDYIYIGDFGNNLGSRTNLRILRVSKSQFINSTASNVNVTADAINFSYADQTSFVANQLNNFDCESMISIGNFLYLFTKNRIDGQTKVYKVSKTPGTYSLTILSTYNVAGLLSGADYNAVTNEIALIGYLPPNAKSSFIYYLNDFTGDQFFSGNVRRVEIGSPNNAWQTEGICYKNSNELFISCETTTFLDAKLFLTNKNSITLGNSSFTKNESLKIYPNPSSTIFNISTNEVIKNIEITSLDGKSIFEKTINETQFQLIKENFTKTSGCYFIKIRTENEYLTRKIIVN